jgi:hypothetical protein
VRKLTVAAILLAAITIIPACCQEAVAVDPAAAVPGMPVIATPGPGSPQAGWAEAVSAEAGPVVEAPAPEVVVPTELPVNPEPVQNWTQTQANNAPQIKYVNTESNELFNRIVEQQIYMQRDVNGNALVPEPSSFIAVAVGLTGMVATVSRRRKKKLFSVQ